MAEVECPVCRRFVDEQYMTKLGACEECLERIEWEGEPDDDPVCVCGVSWSEHALCGCPEGFQTPDAWEREKAFIGSLDDWQYEQIYGDRYY